MLKPTKRNIEIGFMTLFLLLTFQISSVAQTKIFEVEKPNEELAMLGLDRLFAELYKKPESKGLVVIYSDSELKRFGNIAGIITAIKNYARFRGASFFPDRTSFIIAKGEKSLLQEYWFAEKGESFPKFEKIEADFSNLKNKHLFAKECINCEHSISNLVGMTTDFDLLAKILNENPNYELLLVVKGDSVFDRNGRKVSPATYYKNLVKLFSKEHKLKKNRFKFKHMKATKKDFESGAEFYIVPAK